MDKKGKKSRAEDELETLEGVIDYAERMIYDEGRHGEYGPLRRHAYGKTVILETEKEGTLEFRLSSTSATYPNRASGYATPHSPIGRLCSIIQPGYQNKSKRWGKYRALEIRLFDRFDGIKFESNVRNFLRMDIRQQGKSVVITNLRSFLKKLKPKNIKKKSETEELKAPVLPLGELKEPVPVTHEEIKQPEELSIVLTEYAVDEDSDAEDWAFPVDEEESEEAGLDGPNSENEYFGLSETFYLNRTEQQDEVISRSPLGAMYVEGVAGSGKTSAALGRTKMLCDFNAQSVYSEAEFRAIVGDSGDYWSERFAGQFSQESSVGFVRTGELIQYLKETCRRLDLPNLPVEEYPELRSRLKHMRQVERSRSGSRRWTGLGASRETHLETTMVWLRAADQAIARCWADDLEKSIPSAESISEVFKPEYKERVRAIIELALDQVKEKILPLCRNLARHNSKERFALDGLAKRIQNCINPIRNDVLGKQALWIVVGERYLCARSERELAKALIDSHVGLYLQPSSRLVFFDQDGLIDKDLNFISLSGEEINNIEVTKELINEGRYIVRDEKRGETLPAVASDIDDLYIRLLPESLNKLFVQEGGKLKRLRVQKGLGRVPLPTVPAENKENYDTDAKKADNVEQKSETSRSVQAAFTAAMRKKLLQPLTYVADVYSDALKKEPSLFLEKELLSQLVTQFNERKLADQDIDLLLCLYHLIGRGFDGNPQQLRSPPYYQSVFIDEIQDFTEQQIYLMAEQARPEYFAVTAVGDPAQKLHGGGRTNIRNCFPGRSLQSVQLKRNMRQADALGMAWFSARFRMDLRGDYLADVSDKDLLHYVASSNGEIYGPELMTYQNETDLVSKTVELLSAINHKETAVVILPTVDMANYFYNSCKSSMAEYMIDSEISDRIDLSRRHIRHFTAINNAKGLEFDWVILPYFEFYDFTNIQHQNQMYVALTRAKRRLFLLGHNDRAFSDFDHIWQQYLRILENA